MNALSDKWFILILVSLFNIILENVAAYDPPIPTVEPLFPKGLRIFIPHEDGITLVAFHVKFNEDFQGLEAGTIARDIVKVRGGRWLYEDRNTRLKHNDIIYYWIHVIYNGLGYNLIDQQHVVNEFYHYDGTLVNRNTSPSNGCKVHSQTKVFSYDETSNNLMPHSVCSGEVIFEENFNSLNSSQWMVVERFPDAPNDEFVMYMNNEEIVEVKDGALHITPVLTDNKYGQGFVRSGNLVLDRCTGEMGTSECRRSAVGSQILPPVISGRLNTKPSFNFMYGNVKIRAKFPRGDWLYPLLTLESANSLNVNRTSYSVVLIGHSFGNPMLRSHDGIDISGHVLIGGAFETNLNQIIHHNTRFNLPLRTSSKLWSEEYHVYELEWKSGIISVKVDGERYGEQSVPPLYETPVYLNVALAVGGHVLFPDASVSGDYEKPWRNVASKALYNFYLAKNNWLNTWRYSSVGLHVDYIKVTAI
ncbi:beta-1,3-glucan recognition protein 1 [Colletes latitarsis]|uniref:beta-1,3-glucan recognition protein 1 n=1 Tax=Colletes latitarsis TaxID=2605962 RepID=UPI00403537C2